MHASCDNHVPRLRSNSSTSRPQCCTGLHANTNLPLFHSSAYVLGRPERRGFARCGRAVASLLDPAFAVAADRGVHPDSCLFFEEPGFFTTRPAATAAAPAKGRLAPPAAACSAASALRFATAAFFCAAFLLTCSNSFSSCCSRCWSSFSLYSLNPSTPCTLHAVFCTLDQRANSQHTKFLDCCLIFKQSVHTMIQQVSD